ncbi:MAG: D-2-hydroxyacid dehydrogenase [Hydrogenothermaceae bacterium]|nr:D-2-hydroxyacid dehydrogenase [Hydrogenothermaceae bacterium]
MKIAILDAKTLGDDVNLNIFRDFGYLEIHPTTSREETIDRVKDKNIVITNKVVIDKEVMDSAPDLKLICVAATGYNNIDINYAKQKGVAVTNVAGYSTNSVVQHTFAMLFYLLQNLRYYDEYVKSGDYSKSPIFTNLDKPFYEINGKVWGIIGLGTIGRAVGKIAKAFGCKVIYYSTSGKNIDPEFERKSFEELLSISDIISIHAPLTENTKNLITYDRIKLMKKDAILLNLGRGSIVNESDLAKALDEGLIRAAGLDVLEREPINPDNPLLKIKNRERLLITPHIAWTSIEARNKLINEIYLNIKAFSLGKERNRVC